MVPSAPPAMYPRAKERWVELDTGERIFLRPIIPEDVERIAHAFEVADVESIRRRFFTAAPPSDRQHLEYLANVDYVARCALLAFDEHGNSVGLGRYESTRDSAAEVAIVVERSWRTKHVGSILLTALEPIARENGITRLIAIFLAENLPVDKLLASIGYVDRHIEDGAVMVTKTLGDE
ncbi:MAG: GNAT family N-acetyltransferase [Acidimicrobiia bacterium]